MNKFNEMWNMQYELNLKIGKDTVFGPKKHELLFMFCEALNDEIIELMQCYSIYKCLSDVNTCEISEINYKNAKIEVIDCWHFLISIFQILDIDTSQNPPEKIYENICKVYADSSYLSIYPHIIKLLYEINNIKNKTNWKWWSKSVKENPNSQYKIVQDSQELKQFCYNSLEILLTISFFLKMPFDEIYNVYKLKWEINKKRQDNNYDVNNKTEDDNLELETLI